MVRMKCTGGLRVHPADYPDLAVDVAIVQIPWWRVEPGGGVALWLRRDEFVLVWLVGRLAVACS